MRSIGFVFVLFAFSFGNLVSGVVKDPNGKFIPNAKIVIPSINVVRYADNAGNYSISGVPAGTFDILFGADNYQMAYLKDVTFDGTAIVNHKASVFKLNLTVNSQNHNINFVIPNGARSPIRLSIIDMMGRVVSVVAEGNYSSGAYSIPLPSSLSQGVYVVRLNIAGKTLFTKTVNY